MKESVFPTLLRRRSRSEGSRLLGVIVERGFRLQDTPEQPDEREVTGEVVPASQRTIVRVPDSFRDVDALTRIMKEPLPTIAATITGALAMGREDAILAGGRIVQGALKGKLFEQVCREIHDLIDKGKLKEDYAETKYGYKSLVELLQFIDNDVPDEDRLRAAQAMFLALNSVDTDTGDEVVNYHLFQVSKKLSGSQLLTLRATFRLHKEGRFRSTSSGSLQQWLEAVAREVGHGVLALVEQDEAVLISNGLITDRTHTDRSGIRPVSARLTDLGIKFCDYLVSYESEEDHR